MTRPTRILYIAGEMEPFTNSSPLSGLVRSLAEGTQEQGGYDVRVFMPKFGAINERRNRLHEVIRLSGTEVPINGTTDACTVKVASVPDTRIQVYFVGHDSHVPEAPDSDTFPDSHALFFNRAILETLVSLRWIPEVVHGFGWQSALFPVLLQQEYVTHEQMTHEPHFIFTPDSSALSRQVPDGFDAQAADYHATGAAYAASMAPLNGNGTAAVSLSDDDAQQQMLDLYARLEATD